MKISTIRVAAVILGTCLAISGCGGSDSPASAAQQDVPAGSTPVTATAPVTSTTPVTVTTPVIVTPPVTTPVVVPPVVYMPPPPVTGSATLSWVPPTANADGSGLNNLAGYKIYFGSDPNLLSQSVQITNPGLTTYVMANLSAGTTYFVMTSYNTAGTESTRSGVGSKTI
ncbi:MAG: fibronectin type III domain-containing protein [Pseudomonadota bacterium]